MHVFTSRQMLCPSGYLGGAKYHWDLDLIYIIKKALHFICSQKGLEPHGKDGGDKGQWSQLFTLKWSIYCKIIAIQGSITNVNKLPTISCSTEKRECSALIGFCWKFLLCLKISWFKKPWLLFVRGAKDETRLVPEGLKDRSWELRHCPHDLCVLDLGVGTGKNGVSSAALFPRHRKQEMHTRWSPAHRQRNESTRTS